MFVEPIEIRASGIEFAKLQMAESSARGEKIMTQKFLESAVLLDFVSHDVVGWTLLRICAVYKYVGFFV